MHQLRVLLREPSVESAFFVSDVRERLEAIARRVGSPIVLAASSRFGEFTATLGGSVPAALIDEAGIHRAQYVPADSESGRIQTAYVEVHVPGASTPIDVIRNYNYPLGRSKSFRSGQVQPLNEVIAGGG